MSSDSWAVKELADLLRSSAQVPPPEDTSKLTGYRALLVESLDTALDMVGRTGKEVLYGMLEARYTLHKRDLADKPGVYLSALRDLLGSSCDVIERYILSQVKERSGVEAHTIEEAVFRLRAKYGEA